MIDLSYIMKVLVNQRIKNNESQRNIAEKAGMTRTQLNTYENLYRTPKLEQIARIATALGLNVRIIITNTNSGETVIDTNTDCKE